MKNDLLMSAQEKVAKALAEQGDVTVNFVPGICPQVDMITKVITLPLLPEDIPDDLMASLRGWIDHESGHLKYSSMDMLKKIENERDHAIINTIEDCRVDSLQTQRGLGIYKNIKHAYTSGMDDIKKEQINPQVPPWHKALKCICCAWDREVFDTVLPLIAPDGMKYVNLVTDEIHEILDGKIKTREDVTALAKRIKEKWDKEDEEKQKQKQPDDKGEEQEDGEENKKKPKKDGSKEKGKSKSKPSKGDKKTDDKQPKDKQPGDGKEDQDDGPQDDFQDEEQDGEGKQEQQKQEQAPAAPPSVWDKLAKDIQDAVSCIDQPSRGNMPCIPWTENDAEVDMTNLKERNAFMRPEIPDKDLLAYYKTILERVRRMVNVIRRKLLNNLVSIGRVWTLNKTEGMLNDKALHKIGTGDRAVFKRRIKREKTDTAVSLVIDCSGSMEGTRIHTAVDAAVLFAETLDLIKVPFETIGFTADTLTYRWKGVVGRGGEKPPGNPDAYSRLGSLVTYIVKSFDKKHRNCRSGYAALSRTNMGNTNDGEAILMAAKRLAQRHESRKVMFIFSDGQSSCRCSYDQIKYIQETIKKITKAGIEVIGVGICHDAVRKYCKKYVVINDLNNFTETTYKILSEMLQKGGR